MTLLKSILPGSSASTLGEQETQSGEARIKPVFSINEDANGYTVTAQLPGVAKNGLELTAHEDRLKIVGRKAWSQPAGWTTLYRETPRANYELTLTYGNNIDLEKTGAEIKAGVLTITLPKAEAAKPRRINVN